MDAFFGLPNADIECSVNKVVPKSEVLSTAIEWARQICQNSPDAVQSTKKALMLSQQLADVEDVVVTHMRSKEMLRVFKGQNIKVCYFR
jgi:enoyl-CoA hydratase/carnithine racemase